MTDSVERYCLHFKPPISQGVLFLSLSLIFKLFPFPQFPSCPSPPPASPTARGTSGPHPPLLFIISFLLSTPAHSSHYDHQQSLYCHFSLRQLAPTAHPSAGHPRLSICQSQTPPRTRIPHFRIIQSILQANLSLTPRPSPVPSSP